MAELPRVDEDLAAELARTYRSLSTIGKYALTAYDGRIITLMEVAQGAIFDLLNVASCYGDDEDLQAPAKAAIESLRA